MGTDKRARQKANRQERLAEIQAETVKETRERSFKRIIIIGAIVAAIIGLFVLINVVRGGDDTEGIALNTNDSSDDSAEDAPEPENIDELLTEVPADFVPFSGERALAEIVPQVRVNVYDEYPEMTIDPAKSYAAVMNTSAGVIRLELFPDEAPLAVNNFVNLANDGYYDGTIFHRVLENFMAQAGDPTGIGTGGPGYTFEDEFNDLRLFDQRGQLAMANSGPATNGGQFFITFVPTPHLNGLHTIFGQIAGDGEVLDAILLRDPSSGGAATTIQSIDIVEG